MDAEENDFMEEVLSLVLICVISKVKHAIAMRARRPKGKTINVSYVSTL